MTTVFSRRSRLAVVAALPLLVAARPVSPPLAGGTTYEFIVRSQADRTGNKETVTMRGRGTFAGSDGRIDILETAAQSNGSQVFGSKGSYFLTLDGGKKMILVDPEKKQYMEWDVASMLAGMSTMMHAVGGLVKMEMSDVKVDAQSLGAGEMLQGYKTVHYQLTQSYTMTVKVFGRGSKTRNESTIDYFFAPALMGLANPFVSNSQRMSQSLDLFNNPDYKNQMAAAQAKIQYGVPVKTVIKTISTDDKGKQETSVMTTEMVNFKNTDVPKSTFEIPAGYTMVQMPKLDGSVAGGANGAGGTGSGNAGATTGPEINADSAAAAAKKGAAEGVKEGAKGAAKEGAKSKIRGIFKR
jgi:hypothetical protein